MEVNDIMQVISNVGFPIAVAVWYMFVQTKETKFMTQALNGLTNAMTALTEHIKGKDS